MAETRSGSKFICDVPEGYEDSRLIGTPNGTLVLVPKDGMRPPLKLDKETEPWQFIPFTDD